MTANPVSNDFISVSQQKKDTPMFGRKNNVALVLTPVLASEPKWTVEFTPFGNNIYRFPAHRSSFNERHQVVATETFEVILSRFLDHNPTLEVGSMTPYCSDGYTTQYVVIMKTKADPGQNSQN
jgi:hypothetical protein